MEGFYKTENLETQLKPNKFTRQRQIKFKENSNMARMYAFSNLDAQLNLNKYNAIKNYAAISEEIQKEKILLPSEIYILSKINLCLDKDLKNSAFYQPNLNLK